MNLKSLGYRSDLLFPSFDGIIEDRGEYLRIETPTNPHFHWGNFLLFKNEPTGQDHAAWTKIWKKEFPNPEIRHIAFGWDSTRIPTHSLRSFIEKGFDLSESVVLTAQKPQKPSRHNSSLEIRPLQSDWEFSAALENQIACRDEKFSYDDYKEFKQAQFDRYRAMIEKSLGNWFGAFLDGQLVGDLGIFTKDGLARFQTVATCPRHRKLGVCATLVFEASQYALDTQNIHTLVMVADDDGAARRVYESVGFVETEKQCGLSWWQ